MISIMMLDAFIVLGQESSNHIDKNKYLNNNIHSNECKFSLDNVCYNGPQKVPQ